MTAVVSPDIAIPTVSDLLDQLGDVPAHRVLLRPAPGTATVDDVIAIRNGRERRLCELIDGTLVEKAMGYREAILAVALAVSLRDFVVPRNLGLVAGADATLRLFKDMVRIPDVSYVAWSRLPGRRVPDEPVPLLAPTLAVEVLSASNTAGEMQRKRLDYFAAGVELVWIVEPNARTVAVYTAPEQFVTLHEQDTLTGGAVLPGFSLPLRELFSELDRRGGEPPQP